MTRRACASDNGSPRQGLARSIAAALLVLSIPVGLAGCKESDVLTEHIEDELLGTENSTIEPLYKDVENAPQDPTRSSSQLAESDRIDEQAYIEPVFDKDAPANGVAIKRLYNPQSAHDLMSNVGTLPEKEQGDNEDKEDEEEESGETQESSEEPEEEDGLDEGEEEEAAPDADAAGDEGSQGLGGTGKVYNATGTYLELPEGVDAIAAAGQYATIVQMLAGQGGLAACDAEWQRSVAAKGVFPGEGVDKLAAVWGGSAEDGYELDLDALLQVRPSVVLADGVHIKLSEKQSETLNKAGIDVVTVPTLGEPDTADDDIIQAVQLVGQLLRDSSLVTYDTQAAAEAYVKLHDGTIETCLKANGGYSVKMIGGTSYSYIYQDPSGKGKGSSTTSLSGTMLTTAFIDSWTTSLKASSEANRSYSSATPLYLDGQTMDSSTGAGLSVRVGSNAFALMDYYFQLGGVVDNSYDGPRPRNADSGKSLPYLVVPGAYASLVTSSSSTKLTMRNAPSALWYSPTSYSGTDTWVTVGDASFPYLLARSQELAKKVTASASKVNGLYNVGQPYKVAVVPQGLCGSWADGTVESFLLAPWTFCMFQEEGELAECSSMVSSFYETFYRCAEGEGAALVSDYKQVFEATCPTE